MSRNPLPERILSFVGCSLNAIAFKFIASATKVLHIPAFFMHSFLFWHCNQKCLSAGNNSFFLKAARSNTSLFRCCLSALFVDIIMALLPLLLLLLLLSCCNVCCCCKLHAFALDKQTRRKGWQEKSTRSREICMFLLPVDFHFRWQSRRRGVVYIYDWGVARPCEG